MSKLFVGNRLGEINLDKISLNPGRLVFDPSKLLQDGRKLEGIDSFERRMSESYEEFLKKAEEARKAFDPHGYGGVYKFDEIGKFYCLDPLPEGNWLLDGIAKYYRLDPLPEGDWLQDGIAKYYRLDPLPIGRGWDNDDIARFNDWSREYTDEELDALREKYDDSEEFVRRLFKSK